MSTAVVKMETRRTTRATNRGQRGTAVIEASLLAPWVLYLFMAVFDFGFYEYALIVTENAARVAALHAASSPPAASDWTTACQLVLTEMAAMPNTRTLNTCSADSVTDASPIALTVQPLTGGLSADGADAVQVTVAYRTVPLIRLPFLPGQITVTKSVQARLNGA